MGPVAVDKKLSLEDVLLHVRELEERVAALERLLGRPIPHPAAAPRPAAGQPEFTLGDVNFASVGKALLAFAGAYLLRALSESGPLPQSVGVATGIAYALFWMVWAARQSLQDRFGGTLYGLTASIVFSGLVWENSVRLHFVPAPLGAALISLFCLTGVYLAWKGNLAGIALVTTAMSASLVVAMGIANHDVVPFAAAALSITAVMEFAASCNLWLSHRWFPALAADLMVFIAAWVITRPQGLPENYHSFGMSSVVALQITLVLIYVVSMGYRTLAAARDITGFEIVQNTTGIALFIWGSVVMGREAPRARFVVEGFCLLAGLCCYGAALKYLAGRISQRDFRMYGIFGLALVMAGIAILFSGVPLVAIWCFLAVVVSWLGTHEHRISLQLHAPVFLAAAALVCGLMGFSLEALHGASPPDASRLLEIGLTTIAAGLSYWLAGAGGSGKARIPAMLIAALLCWAILGLGGAGITTALGPASAVSSTLRTGLICALAIGLVRIGVGRAELVWLVYPLMLYGAYRLVAEDFPSGRPAAMALSFLFYGGTLLLLTRMLRTNAAATG